MFCESIFSFGPYAATLPLTITRILLTIDKSELLCVAIITVESMKCFEIFSRNLSIALPSKEVVGSSRINNFGFLITALAKAILFLCPPDIFLAPS